ncbi:MAG: ABC transporter permease subunit [Phycisphaeraceae bacterium]|nr:MAG: ABC transporter permease subunit [Phycisphaeraceae bacterium]
MGAARDRRDEIDRLLRNRIPAVQDRLAELNWAERRVERAAGDHDPAGPVWLWAITTLACLGSLAGAVGVWRALPESRSRSVALLAIAVLACGTGLHAVLERPFLRGTLTEQQAQVRLDKIAFDSSVAEDERETLLSRIKDLEQRDDTVRVEIVDPGLDRFAPVAQTKPEEPMRLSQARRVIHANTLGPLGRVRLYLARWGDFLSRPPGESPGEGGVFPVIVGTVVLTMLLTVSVVPLGVIAAIYLREYASQGVVTSVIRIAINNLAGVPSIVYGMFGLGFFCYTMGGYIDGGPGAAALPRTPWWLLIAGLGGLVVLAGLLGAGASTPGVLSGGRSLSARLVRSATWGLWMGAVGLAIYLAWRTPYFHGFFAEKLPEQPTFGARGILWAAFTLALLTLPVVIVATEEAIAAVPGSMREGSLGCGASRWQTIRRIVLPASMPGVLTGAILAMARGAGEVAPLMLVGAVNLAPASPVTATPPFLHGDRTFMHLGFHIYNLGFQSPDAEAARPLVWTTTLLLVAIVLVLNLAAMVIRARLTGRRGGGGL